MLATEERYKAALEKWLWENPNSAHAALALVEFAGVLAADRLVGEATLNPVNDARDAYHQSVALSSVALWLNDRTTIESVRQELAARDSELQALIAEYQRLRDNQPGRD